MTPVLPRPAASVLLVRAGARALEVFLFDSLDALWAAHADGRHKLHGILDRIAPSREGAAAAGPA